METNECQNDRFAALLKALSTNDPNTRTNHGETLKLLLAKMTLYAKAGGRHLQGFQEEDWKDVVSEAQVILIASIKAGEVTNLLVSAYEAVKEARRKHKPSYYDSYRPRLENGDRPRYHYHFKSTTADDSEADAEVQRALGRAGWMQPERELLLTERNHYLHQSLGVNGELKYEITVETVGYGRKIKEVAEEKELKPNTVGKWKNDTLQKAKIMYEDSYLNRE